MKNEFIIGGAAVVVMAVLGYAWLTPSQTTLPVDRGNANGTSPQAVQELNAQVQRLSNEIADLRNPPAELAEAERDQENAITAPAGVGEATQSKTDTPAGPVSEPRPADNAALAADARAQRDMITQALETRMASEEQDEGWGVNAESELADGLQNAGLSSTALVGVACRSTLCKVSLTHANVDAEDEFLSQLANLPGMQDTEIFYLRDEQADGSTQMVVYVGRQGYDMGL